MSDDTLIGGSHDRFPVTHHSAIAGVRSSVETERSCAYESIVTAYWKPVYKYIRMKWQKSNEDAKDLTQSFFTKVMEKEFFNGYDPVKARFRTFLRVCLDGFVSNEEKAASRIKRGGDAQILSLDFADADDELAHAGPPSHETLDEYFDKEWIRHLFTVAVERLKTECRQNGKQVHFSLFERYHIQEAELTYEEVGAEFGLSVSNVTNFLSFARKEFRRIVLEELRDITATDDEFRNEARLVLGVDVT